MEQGGEERVGDNSWKSNSHNWLLESASNENVFKADDSLILPVHTLKDFNSPKKRTGKLLSCVQLFVTPWTSACQAPPSMGFSRQEYWSGLPFPSPGDLSDSGIEPSSPLYRLNHQKIPLLGGFSIYSIEITQVFVLMPFWKIPELQKARLQMEKYKEKKNPIVITVMIAVLKLHWSIKTFTAVSHM